jgi:hypothetical protein
MCAPVGRITVTYGPYNCTSCAGNRVFRSCRLRHFVVIRQFSLYSRPEYEKHWEYRMIIRLVYFFVWLRSRVKQKLRTSRKILGQKMKRTQVQPQRWMSLLRSMMTYHTKPAKTRNKEPSMKNTESIGWLYDWFTFSPDYVRRMKQKLKTSWNKISMQIPVTDLWN